MHQEIAISTPFEALGLVPQLVRAVAEQGYDEPTPIQRQAIPLVLEGRDLLGAAQTGTGKTAGFTLPLLQRLSSQPRRGTAPRCLILTPTRELAAQVEESVVAYGRHLRLSSTVVFGGVGIHPQVAALRRGVDVVVATPGRLLDHVQQKTVDLRGIEILVLDEADRMLDMGFIRDMRRILALLPRDRQTLLFSATFSDEIRSLAREFLRNPATVEVARRNTPAELVTQVVHPVDRDRKRALLAKLILDNQWFQVLVFTKTKHGANRLAEQLERDGIEAAAIHGNKSQGARTRALSRFKDNSLRVLVATDIAARGLDIEALPHVVNFDLPNVPEDYVHRIGRTGRAGAEGEAVSLLSAEDRPLLSAIEKLMGRRIEQRVVAGYEPGQAPLAATSPAQPPARAPHGRGRGHGVASPGGRSPAGRPQPHAKSTGAGPGAGHRSRDGDSGRAGHAPTTHRPPRPAAAPSRPATSDARGGSGGAPAAATGSPAPRPSGLFADRGSGRTRRR